VKRALQLVAAPLLLGFGAAFLGSLALFAMALGLLAIYVGAGAAVLFGRRRLRVVRTVDRHEVLEGQEITLHFAVRGLRGLPVHLEVQGGDGRWVVLPPGGGTVRWSIDRPGGHVLEPSPLRVRDDLGLMARAALGGEPEALLVLPVPASLPLQRRRMGAELAGDPEPDGLRPYVPGTPMSRIHWAAAARGAELQERSFITARDHLPLVVVETAGAPDEPAMDWTARMAAGHVLALAQSGGCRVLLPGDLVPTVLADGTGQWPLVHRRLAALERRPAAAPAQEAPDTVLVSAARAPIEGLRARRALPPGVVPLASWSGAA
jgi:uncharacterized protein (DUF58 family)